MPIVVIFLHFRINGLAGTISFVVLTSLSEPGSELADGAVEAEFEFKS
jgi:hypothetical protein